MGLFDYGFSQLKPGNNLNQQFQDEQQKRNLESLMVSRFRVAIS